MIEDPLRRSLVLIVPVVCFGALCVEDKRALMPKWQRPTFLGFMLFCFLIQWSLLFEMVLACWIAELPL
jgi:hypothetical protein